MTRPPRLYAISLTPKSPKIFKDKNDTEPVKAEKAAPAPTSSAKDKKGKSGTADTSSAKKEVRVEIDFNGINNRITALPGEAGEYRIVGAADGGLIFISNGKLMKYNIADEKNEEILDRAMSASLTSDGKMAMYRSGEDYGIIKLTPGQKAGAGKMNFGRA